MAAEETLLVIVAIVIFIGGIFVGYACGWQDSKRKARRDAWESKKWWE